MDSDKFDGKMLDARDYIHAHPGQPAAELPARKVRPYLRALERRGMIEHADGAWRCRCKTCELAS